MQYDSEIARCCLNFLEGLSVGFVLVLAVSSLAAVDVDSFEYETLLSLPWSHRLVVVAGLSRVPCRFVAFC